ncbi:pentapeptide repeat-containing protein [Mesorhizobium sp. AR10]|uniref:pentapeptide repeat-containing protein n=1 Tax=Mesorhizobium sp. AR10 TaxID=2865839 RepID=UPI0021600435|nr:pentapeptide repeat-containing protein [Mesorhizobium sp. AR10]UVK39954.1 pentapeptide repeat-containing protein [Mesorhizobium sp. AR10]
MKDSPYLTGILSESQVAALQSVAKASEAPFEQMVKLGGLQPSRDLRFADLQGVNISDSDIRGFDFTGADLRDCVGVRFKMDSTTILDGAELSGSIFAAKARLNTYFESDERARKLLTTVARGGWVEQIEWAGKNLSSSGKYHDVAVPIVEELFYRAVDPFLKAELMRYVAPRLGSDKALREMLFAAISDQPDTVTLVRSAASLLKRHGMASDTSVRQIMLSLVDSPNNGVREKAVQFIMRSRPAASEIDLIREKAKAGDNHFGGLFVAETARRLGDDYDLVTRDPGSNATFPLGTMISSQIRYLIARRWLRAESSQNEQSLSLVQRRGGLNYANTKKIEERALRVQAMWDRLAEHGIHFQLFHEPIETSLTLKH